MAVAAVFRSLNNLHLYLLSTNEDLTWIKTTANNWSGKALALNWSSIMSWVHCQCTPYETELCRELIHTFSHSQRDWNFPTCHLCVHMSARVWDHAPQEFTARQILFSHLRPSAPPGPVCVCVCVKWGQLNLWTVRWSDCCLIRAIFGYLSCHHLSLLKASSMAESQ